MLKENRLVTLEHQYYITRCLPCRFTPLVHATNPALYSALRDTLKMVHS